MTKTSYFFVWPFLTLEPSSEMKYLKKKKIITSQKVFIFPNLN